MNPDLLRSLLEALARGEVAVAEVVERIRHLPFSDIEGARLDHHRELRTGMPEVVFGEGKTAEQIVAIAREMIVRSGSVLVTRIDAAKAGELVRALDGIEHHPDARIAMRRRDADARIAMGRRDADARIAMRRRDADARIAMRRRDAGECVEQQRDGGDAEGRSAAVAGVSGREALHVAVVSAGTSDQPVAEEAARTLEFLGIDVRRYRDLGISGLHRLLAEREKLGGASVVIVVAGMEGALPSVVGGLVDVPVIAVPTSIGYGASYGGLAALLAMMNSCAPGVTVVNIDNGFGAAVAAAAILRVASR
jgi:NCAIR mutase (PurE)-related protein